MAITVRSQDKLYRFPDDTPQDVMKGAIDKHIASFQSLKGTSAITSKLIQEPLKAMRQGRKAQHLLNKLGKQAVEKHSK